MNQEIPLLDFIRLPTTIDFVTRLSDFESVFSNLYPKVRASQILSGRYVIGYVDEKDIDTLSTSLRETFAQSMPFVMTLLGRQELESAGIIRVQEQPFLDLRGKGVLVGIIDTGIDYTLDTFRNEDGTSRIAYLFDQSIEATPPRPPVGTFVGTEYTQAQINEALRSENPFGIVPSRDTVGHGTFLASIAAGKATVDFTGAAPESELIIVKLKKARPYYVKRYLVPPDQENVYSSTAVMAGVEFILNKARELARPVSICIGVGTNMGAHDGYSILGEYLYNVSNLNAACTVIAAGNESQARHHTLGTISETGGTQNIEIRVPENSGDFFISVLSTRADRISVSVTSPTGEQIDRVPAKSSTFFQTRLVLERTVIQVEYSFPMEVSGGQSTIVKFLKPTPGIWIVTLYGDIILDGTYHAYLPITGLAPPGVEFLAPNPNYTITVPGTSTGPITIGAYNSFTNSLYSESSWGPTRLPALAPDLVAPGVEVEGIFPGGAVGRMSGTSVAAAITAGACALMLQWGIIEKNNIALSTYQIKAFLVRGANRDQTLTYPNNQWGFGSINLIQTFNMMRGI